MFNQLKSKIMKVYVLTEIDLRHVGYSPNTIQIFPTHEKAVNEMKEMYERALQEFGTTEGNAMNVFDEGGYAYVGDADYRLDIYECDVDLSDAIHNIQELTVVADERGVRTKLMDRNMSRPDVWYLVQKWAEEFDEKTKDFAWGEDHHFYDEVDSFVDEKSAALDKPELRPMSSNIAVELNDEKRFGGKIFVHLHAYDGYAVGDGIRVVYPKLADLTADQIEEIDGYIGGRIKDSGIVVPEDVLLKYGVVQDFGIMDDTNGHNPDLVRRINVAWAEGKDRFRPILCALYDRDHDEIYSHSVGVIGELPDSRFHTLSEDWERWAGPYLRVVADDGDLESILYFLGIYDRR